MADREPFSKVSDLHNWLGLSENGIRLYENEGIISPKRNSANRYRTLNISDGDRMFRSRILTGYGFSVRESAELLTACTFEEQDEFYMRREKELNEEIILTSFKLHHMMEMRELMQEMKNDFSACSIVDAIHYSFLPVHDQHQNKEDGSDECAAWLGEVPFVTSTVVFDPQQKDPKYLYGPSLLLRDALRLQLPLEHAIDLGSQSPQFVRGFCTYPLEDNIRAENYAHIKTFAEKEGYELCGKAAARHIILEKVAGGGITYDEVLIPIRRK